MTPLDVQYWTLARLKGIFVFVGSTLTFATTALGLPLWATGVAALFTFIGTYATPNATVMPDPTANTHGGEPAADPNLTWAGPEEFGTADSERDLPDHAA